MTTSSDVSGREAQDAVRSDPAGRVIHLRRPPTISIIDEPFVPRTVDLDEIDRRWQRVRQSTPAAFDGRLLHVFGVHRNGCGGAVIHAADGAYRFHAVQDDAFDLGVRPLGVKGITSRDGRVLLGRRAKSVLRCAGLWEFAPGGVVEPGRTPSEVVRAELAEETGLGALREPTAVAILYDTVVRSWEIVFQLSAGQTTDPPPTPEYDELRWCEPGAWPEDLSPIARQMTRLV